MLSLISKTIGPRVNGHRKESIGIGDIVSKGESEVISAGYLSEVLPEGKVRSATTIVRVG